jgi:hypothetical protein
MAIVWCLAAGTLQTLPLLGGPIANPGRYDDSDIGYRLDHCDSSQRPNKLAPKPVAAWLEDMLVGRRSASLSN